MDDGLTPDPLVFVVKMKMLTQDPPVAVVGMKVLTPPGASVYDPKTCRLSLREP